MIGRRRPKARFCGTSDATDATVEAVPRHTEIRDKLGHKICRGLPGDDMLADPLRRPFSRNRLGPNLVPTVFHLRFLRP